MKNRIEVVKGDITQAGVDAVVNAANSSLLGGGGVDGAIHRAGGKSILEECMQIRSRQGGCPIGEAVITTAGNMSATYVIHTVGPVWQGGKNEEEQLLANAYRNSLALARANGCRTLAFPNISTGVYGFPKPLAARIAYREVAGFLQQHPEDFDKIWFICFDEQNYCLYVELMNNNP
jgi:O-acetyl-ADP-ribose deacetylase (regulator of RNase III)